MPLQATSGAASYDAFGGGAAAAFNYIEDVFSTNLYTGTGSPQAITNDINLSGKGGMVWTKGRTTARNGNIVDSARGVDNMHYTNTTGVQFSLAGLGYSSYVFGTNGFTNSGAPVDSENTYNFVSWTFRKQPKFFDVVTFTKSTSTLSVPHNLGSIPGCVIIKSTNIADEWYVYHRGLTSTNYNLKLNRTFAEEDNGLSWISLTSTNVNLTSGLIPNDGNTYVMYVFAHDAGGFGLTGTDNVISCGSFTTDGSGGATINLGYEPQWFLHRKIDGAGGDWELADVMRKFAVGSGNSNLLYPNSTSTEAINQSVFSPTSTGVTAPTNPFESSVKYIYIAIRRGPMKVPTVGTSVFSPITRTGTGANTAITGVGFTPDVISAINRTKTGADVGSAWIDRLRGTAKGVFSSSTGAESSDTTRLISFDMDGVTVGSDGTGQINESPRTYINYLFRRAPGFFDEVCYTGTGSATTFSHNLAAVPELMIVKRRSAANAWAVYANNDNTDYLVLNTTAATADDNTYWNDTSPTSSVFSVGTNNAVNASASTYVAYLFATCAGVSKVGSYTGNGSTQTIDCGFTGGARFVLIKRTDSTGGWYVYDTARGMTVLTDPYLLLNSTAAESATLGSVTTVSTGFALNSTILAAINVSGGTYIFLAIA
jgi:hypothetical protein